jgi:hypothetical protein
VGRRIFFIIALAMMSAHAARTAAPSLTFFVSDEISLPLSSFALGTIDAPLSASLLDTK